MENKKEKSSSPSSRSKKSHPTVLGSLFFAIFNLILLSLLAWVLLVGWFCIQAAISNSESVAATVKKITAHQFSYHPDLTYGVLHVSQNIKDTGISYIDENVANIIIGTIEIILTRAYLFIVSIPFMGAILFVLITDGLAQRDIRKFQGARESTFFFHRLKPLAGTSFFFLFFLYMAIPLAIPPEVFLIPIVVLSGVFTMLVIKSFKKYI